MAFDPAETVPGVPFPVIFEPVTAHEVAHQWFCNLVGNDQIDEPWLDEVLAQYATWLYFVDACGEQNARGFRASWEDRWQRVGGAAVPIGLPAYAYVRAPTPSSALTCHLTAGGSQPAHPSRIWPKRTAAANLTIFSRIGASPEGSVTFLGW